MSDSKAQESGAVRIEEVESSPAGVVKRWLSEWDLADTGEKTWREESQKILDLYRSKNPGDNTFNILWSNTETLRPAVYNSTPRPDVRRRYRDADPVGKVASTILERALTYTIDVHGLDHEIHNAVLDTLLCGRGVGRVAYEPVFLAEEAPAAEEGDWLSEPIEPAEPEVTVVDEGAPIRHVPWEKFRRGAGKTWAEVTWLGFEHTMTYTELERKFGKDIADQVQLAEADTSQYGKPETHDKDVKSLLRTAVVYEIWDRATRRVLFITSSVKSGPLLQEDDPLQLTGFFPAARPIYAIEDSGSLVPEPLYKKYQQQAFELNRVTNRINKVVNALKVRGAYASALSEVPKVLAAGDNQMVPIENASELANIGGLDKAIWIMPIDRLVAVLEGLYVSREKTIQAIYEITGLGDVMRGVSNPHETLGAQQIKSQWGSLRLQRLQREVQRFIRDLLRLSAEVMSEHFSAETFQAMTGIKLPTAEEKQRIQMQLQQMQMAAQGAPGLMGGQQAAPPQPPDPKQIESFQQILQLPTWEDVIQLLQSDDMRQYRIDIETDSTVNETLQRDAEGMNQSIQAMMALFGGAAPAVQAGWLKVDVVKSLALAVARTQRMGQAVEDAIEQISDVPPGPDPAQMQQQIEEARKELEKKGSELQKGEQQLKDDVQKAKDTARGEQEQTKAVADQAKAELQQILDQIKEAQRTLDDKKRDIETAEKIAAANHQVREKTSAANEQVRSANVRAEGAEFEAKKTAVKSEITDGANKVNQQAAQHKAQTQIDQTRAEADAVGTEAKATKDESSEVAATLKEVVTAFKQIADSLAAAAKKAA